MKIRLSRLSNSILSALANRVINTSKHPEYTVVNNHPLLVTLEAEHNGFILVFGKQTFSGLGQTVENADITRDALFSGMKTILLGYTKTTGHEFQQDAIDLFTIFENRGLGINLYSYADESTEMEKLIVDISKPENLLKLEHLHLTDLFGMMKTAQTDFESIYALQTKTNTGLRQMQSSSSILRNLETALHNYLNIVEAMKHISCWETLHTELSEVVKAVRNSKQDPTKEDTAPTEN